MITNDPAAVTPSKTVCRTSNSEISGQPVNCSNMAPEATVAVIRANRENFIQYLPE